jgi:hypothetical protein
MKREPNDYYRRIIEGELAEIDKIKNSIAPEDILWSTKLGVDSSYCHTIYFRIWRLLKSIDAGKLNGIELLSKPKEEASDVDTVMRVYTAWVVLLDFLPTEENPGPLSWAADFSGAREIVDVQFLKYVRGELDLIAAMLKQVMDQ